MSTMSDGPDPKARRTKTRFGKIAPVFSPRYNADLHALIACLCVLFEDLRIEINGMAELDLGRMDGIGRNFRTLYFLRRSIATLHEFAEALSELDRLADFQPISLGYSPLAARHWSRAIAYFQKHEKYILRIRHHVSGHFGPKAARQAINNLLPDAVGSIEVSFHENGGGAKLRFAGEIAATALLRNTLLARTRSRRSEP